MSNDQTFPNLHKAPIKTAIIEIRYHWVGPQEDSSSFASLASLINKRLPNQLKGEHKDINFEELPNNKIKGTIVKTFVRDYRFTSEDKKSILLTSTERFNFNLNDNYSSWESFIGDFKFFWTEFITHVVDPTDFIISGVSIRYINNISIPSSDDLSEYFNTTVYAEKTAVPFNINSYLINYRANTEDGIDLIITQGVDPTVGKLSYIFDIDVIKNTEIDNVNLWETFERLRYIKNQTFFSNLTEKTLSMIS